MASAMTIASANNSCVNARMGSLQSPRKDSEGTARSLIELLHNYERLFAVHQLIVRQFPGSPSSLPM